MDLELEGPDEEDPKTKQPSLGQRAYAAVERALGPAAPALPITLFVVGWAYLNALLSSPFPPHGYGLVWLTPSPEATAYFGLIAVVCFVLQRPPRALMLLFMLAVVPLWLLRSVDHLMRETFGRPFHVATDLGDLWALFILLDDTVDRFTIILTMVLSAAVLGVLFTLAFQALAHAERFFALARPARITVLVLVVLLGGAELATGAVFSESLALRGVEEIAYASGASEAEAERAAAIDAAIAAAGEPDLAVLREADVHVIVVPRYAQLLRDDPRFSSAIQDRWASFEAALEEARYRTRSTLLASNEHVGFDAYEVAALHTGVPVPDRQAFGLVAERAPPSLGDRYHAAGYRTVHVLAHETRARPEREPRGYDLTQHAWELGYLGFPFGRSPMPDQYILAFIRDRELWQAEEPLFVFYELSSSLPPFSPRPPYLEDWASVARGDVYRTPEPGPSTHSVFALEETEDDYRAAMLYVIGVLEGYLTEHVDSPAPEGRGRASRRARRRRPAPLYVVVGDRPPLITLAGAQSPRGVIAHAFSREEELLAPFEEAGWTAGLVPTGETTEATHDSLAVLLTRGMSSAATDEGATD